MIITHYDQTETKMVVGLLAALKRMLHIIGNQLVFLKTHHYGHYLQAFNNAPGKLRFQTNEIYLLRDFNITLLYFFKVIISCKKILKDLKRVSFET